MCECGICLLTTIGWDVDHPNPSNIPLAHRLRPNLADGHDHALRAAEHRHGEGHPVLGAEDRGSVAGGTSSCSYSQQNQYGV